MGAKRFHARIIPTGPHGGAHKTHGTKVMVGDVELAGISRIVLTADVNDVWRAEIHCFAHAPEVEALATLVRPRRPWWRLLLR